MNLPKELTARIADHLSNVRKNLSSLPPDERQEILQAIESHIYDALQSKSDAVPTSALLEAVLAEMDPPESYGELPVVPEKNRRWRTTVFLLALIALVAIVYPALNHIKRPAAPEGTLATGQPTGTLITEGVGWKDYVIGKTRAELIQALGTPQTNTPEWMLRWDKYPYIDVAMSEANTCREVRFNRGFTGQTAAGIKIGSSLQEMREAYGNAEITWARTPGPCVIAEWPNKGIVFYTHQGHVSQIIICEPKPKYTLPFIDDPAVHGRWVSIDLVDSIDAFNPRKQTSEAPLSLKELTFSPEGKTSQHWTWTRGRLIAEDSLSSYTIKKIGGEDYLFIEWMSGDVIEKGLPPKYYVFKKANPEVAQTKNDLKENADTQKGTTMKRPLALTAASILAATNLIAGEAQTGLHLQTANNNTALGDTPALPQVEVRKASDGVIAKQKELARCRMRKDSKIYSQEELQEIESLYQVANKKWRSEEGKESLKELISKYKSANRTGCALLYLGQMTTGNEQFEYLQQAISEFSDCFYGDGTQVGAFARFVLLHRYRRDGETEKAAKLAEEIRTDYPDAIDHRGRNIVELLETAEN